MILPLMLCAASCQPATVEQTAEERAGVVEQVRQASNEIFEANREVFTAGIRPAYESYASVDMDVDTMSIAVLGPQAAVVTWFGTVTVTDTAGNTVRNPTAATWVWAVPGSKWVVVHAHASHALPEVQ